MIKQKPDIHCGRSDLQLVHYINDYGHRLKVPAYWHEVDKVWRNQRGEQVTDVVDFEPMVENWKGN